MNKKKTALLLSASLFASPMHSLAEASNEVIKTESIPVIQPQEQHEEVVAEETTTAQKSKEVINEDSREDIVEKKDIEESIKNGWIQENGSIYYYINNVVQKDWKYIEEKWFYFHEETGVMQTGWHKDGTSWYYLDANGVMQTDWYKDGGSWYYFGQNGVMQTGWQKHEGSWYYFGQNGVMQTGWYKDGENWYYFGQNGVMQTGWHKDEGNWYYFGSNGAMQTGWQKHEGSWYYFDVNGAMQTGWQKHEGSWYYFDVNGAMQTGWQKHEGSWYYFGSNGVMQTGWYKDGGSWYYFGSNGVMQTGWYKDGGNWYYFGSNGAMQTGWIADGGKWYYLYEDGVMKKGQAYLDAPIIFQLPELKNGCEVVSMTMMLKYHGYNVDKMSLAMQLPLDTTPVRTNSSGQIVTWGDPAVGFVGDVKGISKGYSIDPAPLKKVLDRYTNSGIDLTGSDFTSIERLLEQGKPVVTWITASFSHPVAPKSWRTTSGKTIYADFDMHAVLVTGYDDNYIYFNDPLRRGKGAKVSKSKFISSYNYMGKKALSMN
ncbi:C39 family peptidase [Bacillus manliponensis]|uniref:C39 family peptidase n=1 Tax=Bacillus manliponensis TaxID=574376 RepID=UPI003519178A